VGVAIAPEVGLGNERRESPGPCRLDLTGVLAQLGLDERQIEERVRLGLGRERLQLRVRAGERLAVLADLQEAVLRQAPALVAGDRPEADVVLLRAREVDEVRPGLAGWHRHEVDLRAAEHPDRRLVATAADDLVGDAEVREPFHQRPGVVGFREQVDVADRLPLPPE
jgi:hypothetical protein